MASVHISRIDDLELFADCTKAELRQIGSLTTFLHVARDRVLMREGSTAKEFIIIGSGTARISRETDEGVANVADVGSGEFFGEVELLTGRPRSVTATAATDLAANSDQSCASLLRWRTRSGRPPWPGPQAWT
jgi:protein lysine acetyltransferase